MECSFSPKPWQIAQMCSDHIDPVTFGSGGHQDPNQRPQFLWIIFKSWVACCREQAKMNISSISCCSIMFLGTLACSLKTSSWSPTALTVTKWYLCPFWSSWVLHTLVELFFLSPYYFNRFFSPLKLVVKIRHFLEWKIPQWKAPRKLL